MRGAQELRVKESDRLAAMAAGLTVLGVETGCCRMACRCAAPAASAAARVDSHGDHRIAMAFAVAALRAREPIEILDVANVATSFPGFLDTARAAGLQIRLA